MLKITIQIRQVYGRETIYPACPVSALLAELAGTTTLTNQALRTIRQLGYEIEVEAPRIRFAAIATAEG